MNSIRMVGIAISLLHKPQNIEQWHYRISIHSVSHVVADCSVLDGLSKFFSTTHMTKSSTYKKLKVLKCSHVAITV